MSPDPLNQLLAGQAAKLVHENFTDVTEQWWWERRIGGGVAICQTLDPEKMTNELSEEFERSPSEVKMIVERELGLDDFDPLTLTFEIPGDVTPDEAAKILSERSASSKGIASGVYREVEAALKRENP